MTNGARQQPNGPILSRSTRSNPVLARSVRHQATPPPSPPPTLVSARGTLLPQQPEITERSLQINIDSTDDAKSVIQNLSMIKAAWEAAGVNSVEFCIAKEIVQETESTLRGAINWCRTYVRHMAALPGNVLFILPGYRELTPVKPKAEQPKQETGVTDAATAPVAIPTPLAQPLSPSVSEKTHVKPLRPVSAAAAKT